MRAAAIVILLAAGVGLISAPVARNQVGYLPDGGFLLNSGWRLTPAGLQVPLDTLPLGMAKSPDGRYIAVTNAGYLPPSISVLSTASRRELARTPVKDAWLGLAFSADGRRLYAGGAAQASVFEFEFANTGALKPLRTFEVTPEKQRKPQDFIGDICLSPDGRLLYAADLYRDSVVVIDVESGAIVRRFATGSRPYRVRVGRESLLVTGWADGHVYLHALDDGRVLRKIEVGPHPTDMVLDGATLYVAAANTNYVAEVDLDGARVTNRINVSLTPRQPVGMTPSSLAFSPDRSRLYVACSDANSVAVVERGRGKPPAVTGFIPTGWYPTAVATLADGVIFVLNSRGVRSLPNPEGPNPGRREAVTHRGLPGDHQYIARILLGTAAFIPAPDAKTLAAHTKTVLRNCPYRDEKLSSAGVPKGNPVPDTPGQPSPIRHVLYIVKENRTYDQVLGDMKEGLGDPSLTIFGEEVTPNQHKLAREFVLFDNFYVNADVSADGHNWSTAAISPDYVQKLWGTSYGSRRQSHDYYGPGDVAALAPGGYIWNRVAAAGLSMRNYGYYASNVRQPRADGVQVSEVGDPVLKPVTCLQFRGYDLNYPEHERAQVFAREIEAFDRGGELPRFMVMHLGRNHTAGAAAGRISPQSMVADNDYAVGLVVEALSKTRFWRQSAVFILEDDAQNGPDHIDAHRSPAFIVSPYTRRGIVDSSMYNTASMLRTIELILGVAPMTHFDAGAPPMWTAFHSKPDARPYAAEKPRISLDLRNPQTSARARREKPGTFDHPDTDDDDELNAEIWRAVRGSEPPPPVRSAFSVGPLRSESESRGLTAK